MSALRAAWGVAPDQPLILHAARLTTWKGQRYVIEAVGQSPRGGPARRRGADHRR